MKIAGYPDVQTLIARLEVAGHGGDVEWAENLGPPANADEFAQEIIFVICNSGMNHVVARRIYDKVMGALRTGARCFLAFKHQGKAFAIEDIWRERRVLFAAYKATDDKLGFIAMLPWIGGVTKYHVAKNFGLQYAKPDVHLTRLAKTFDTTPQAMCELMAKRSGYKVATIDTLLWRAAAIGILDTQTGIIK